MRNVRSRFVPRTARKPIALIAAAMALCIGSVVVDGAPAGAAPSPPRTSQSISFTSTAPSPALVGRTYRPTAVATSGLRVTFTLGKSSRGCALVFGTVVFYAPGTCVLEANQAGNKVFSAAPRVSQTVTITKAAQAIVFTSVPPSPTLLGGTYKPTARASSGLAVTITRDASSTGCTLKSGRLTFTAYGTCIVNADQGGNLQYAAAPRVQQVITIGKRTQTVSFTSSPASPSLVGSTYTPVATATSGLPVALTLDTASVGCTLASGVVTFTATGTCVVNADQAGDSTYAAASRAQQSIQVVKKSQTVAFTSTAPTSPTVGGSYTPTATATSGLAVAITLDAGSAGCTLASGVVTFTAAGTCVLNADQAGDDTYDPATRAQQSIDVAALPEAATAVDDAATVARYSTSNTISVLGNDTNPSGVPVAVTAVTQPAHGTVTIAADGQSVDYVPATDYCNTDALGTTAADTFTYTLTGGSTATVSVKVEAPNDAPVIATITSRRGSAAAVPIVNYTDPASNIMRNTLSIAIDAPVSDPGACGSDSLDVSWVLAYDGASGPYRVQGITGYDSPTLNIAPNSLLLAPNPPGVTFSYIVTSKVTGKESRVDFLALVTQSLATEFQYEQCQARTAQCQTPVLLPTGLPATSVDDVATVLPNSAGTTINVRTNDTSDYPDPRITAVTQPAHGTVTINPGAGAVSYVPAAGYCNSDSAPDTFTYTLNGNATATVSVTVPCE